MKSHSVSHASLFGRSMTVRLFALALTVLFTASQVPAQGPMDRDASNSTQTAGAQITGQQAATTQDPAEATDQPAEKTVLMAAPVPNSEQATLVKPDSQLALAAMQGSPQNLQSTLTAPSEKKGVQRPGMLVMGIAGIPLIAFGTWVMTRSVTKDASLKNVFGAAFLVPGAAMSGFGFYYAFHKKNQ